MIRRKDSAGKVLKDGESERKNGYQFRYTVNGKRKYIYAKTLAQLREKEANISKEKKEEYTVDDIYKKYISLKEKTISKHTVAGYARNYRLHIEPAFGDKLITKVKKNDVVNFLAGLKLKGGTVHRIHCVLHGIFEYALDDELIEKNPCHNATKNIKSTTSRIALTTDEQILFLKKAKEISPSFYPIFSFMLETGLRVGEVCALRWEDIDFDEKVIDIKHSLKYYIRNTIHMEIGPPKTPSSIRQIPLTGEAIENLIEERERQKYNNIHCKSNIDGFDDFVFLGKEGTIRNYVGLNKQIKKIIKGTNLPSELSCHILRHTFCTRLCEANVNIKVIQELMGHSSIKVTMDVYTDVTKSFAKQEFAKFDGFVHQ